MTQPKVEMHPAYLWTCDACGRDNFSRCITVAPESIDPDDLPGALNMDADEIREWLEAGGEGRFQTYPDQVTCSHCGAEFETDAS